NDNEREEVIDLNKPILAELYASPLNKENVAFQVVADRRPDNNEYGSGTGTAADPICLEETIMDGLQASFSDGENLPVNTTTERKPSQEEVQPRPMQNKPDSELGSEKCVDLHVSRPIYKWPIIVEKQRNMRIRKERV
uniref:Uncharacterized protein n=3 Tax=Parascaris univalens TaxID=6257 RepID=A0A915A3A4_PARUN